MLNPLDLLKNIKDKYLTDENPNLEDDKKFVDIQERHVTELLKIQSLLQTEGGKILKKWLLGEMEMKIKGIIAPNTEIPHREELISDLRALLALFNKLKVDSELDGVQQHLQGLLEQE